MGARAMTKDKGIDQAEVISTKKLNSIVKNHSKHAAVVLYDDVAKKELEEKTISRRVRNANDKAVWDVVTADREWAWKVIMACCAMLSNGMGFGISNMMRTGKGFDSDVTRGALWLATYSQWCELAQKRGLSAGMCTDVLWEGLSFAAVDAKHKRRRHTARQNLADCLDLMVEMRDELPLKVRHAQVKRAGLALAAEAGINVTKETLAMDKKRPVARVNRGVDETS